MRRTILIGSALALVLSGFGCGYGKDTGPKTPVDAQQFDGLVDQFMSRTQSCFGEVFQANMGREATEVERADQARVKKAMDGLKAELMGCLTGKGYGNEVQVEGSMVEGWLAQEGCVEFARAAFKAPQCIAIQSAIEEAGFSPDGALPPAEPPRKKRSEDDEGETDQGTD